MSAANAPVAPSHVTDVYVARIEAHLVRLTHGHDPLGHLFAIERLARAARAELRAVERQTGRTENGQ